LASEKPWKRLIFRWTARKGVTAIILFLALALFIEYLLVRFFMSYGLTDESVVAQTFQFPGTSLYFTMAVSPLFHLIPIGVVAVLVSSWIYLIRHVAVVPRKTEHAKKELETRRERRLKMRRERFKWARRFSKTIGKKFQGISRAFKGFSRRVKAAFLRIRGVSYLTQRLAFARAAIKSTVTVISVFILMVLAIYLMAYPRLIQDAVVGFYKGNPSFHGFVLKTIDVANAIVSPIGGIASAINDALRAVAPGFRSTIEGLGAAISGSLVKLDLTSKYLICQNFAAWISAIAAVAYGQYASRRYRRGVR